jgi:hypothetical protein
LSARFDPFRASLSARRLGLRQAASQLLSAPREAEMLTSEGLVKARCVLTSRPKGGGVLKAGEAGVLKC